VRPDPRRSDVARQSYFEPWTLALVDMFHVSGLYYGTVSFRLGAHQYLIGVHSGR
jgi:hypothetical protein